MSIGTTSALAEVVNQFQKGIAAFAGLDHTFSFVTLKDTGTITESHYSRESINIITRNGKISFTPENYMKIIESFKPDFFHTLCDGDTNDESGNKRIYNAVNRTYAFFKKCAELYKASATLADSIFVGKRLINDRNKHFYLIQYGSIL